MGPSRPHSCAPCTQDVGENSFFVDSSSSAASSISTSGRGAGSRRAGGNRGGGSRNVREVGGEGSRPPGTTPKEMGKGIGSSSSSNSSKAALSAIVAELQALPELSWVRLEAGSGGGVGAEGATYQASHLLAALPQLEGVDDEERTAQPGKAADVGADTGACGGAAST